MKKLFFLPLLVLLTGCVTYYQPETALEDGVYYAEDDPSYVFNSGDYSGVVYYPWSSLDYFYLGYRSYPGYGFVYDYPFGWAYSPWGYGYGYYGHYSPWYSSRHQNSYWRPYRGNCSHHGRCRQNNSDDHDGEVYRYASTAPTGNSGNQGKVVRNRRGTKIGKNRVEPADPGPAGQDSATPSAPGAAFHPPATSTPNTFSRNRNNTRPPSVSSRSSHQPSMSSKSSRRRDRD